MADIQSDSSPAPLSRGTVLDKKYRVESLLGKGAFGVVYRARDQLAGRDVAIKALRQTDFSDQSDLIWEIQQLSQLKVPNVLSFYHHFDGAGTLYLVMEYCGGGSLADALSKETYNEAVATGLVMKLAAAMQKVHEAGVVHHDIKPANILFLADGEPLVSDFGVANRHAGTTVYMAPELFLGEALSATDPRVDIYALALTLMEMLTADRPFRGLSRQEMLQAKINQGFVPKSISEWLREIILRGTHPTPERRFQSMSEFQHALHAKRVPMVMSANRIRAHSLAELGAERLAKKNWLGARKALSQSLEIDKDCLAAVVAFGKLELALHNRERAIDFLMRAASMSPRVAIQKELGYVYLLEGDHPRSISMLTDYLDRYATDFEAYSLLMQCYFEMGRYDAADELGQVVAKQKPRNDCFECNRFLSRLLRGGIDDEFLTKYDPSTFPPFLRYNLTIAKEGPVAWSKAGKPSLKTKVLWHDFRFGAPAKKSTPNEIALIMPDGYRYLSSKPIITIGTMEQNEVPMKSQSVSRRHAVILNWPNDVWICDLGSTQGTTVDGERIIGRKFLSGVHEVDIGSKRISLATNASLLV